MTKKEVLEILKSKCEKCLACELGKTRNKLVFSDGNPDTAKAILIGEAPGANEDMSGTPFVGRAGKLLNDFLAQVGIDREKDLYIINTVKCRPPQNRVPTNVEKEKCVEYLYEQIRVVNPKILIFCGSTALQSFYYKKVPISKIRGEWLDIDVNGQKYKSMPIFHPSYLLRNHSMEAGKPRALMLEDLKKIRDIINS